MINDKNRKKKLQVAVVVNFLLGFEKRIPDEGSDGLQRVSIFRFITCNFVCQFELEDQNGPNPALKNLNTTDVMDAAPEIVTV